MGDFLKATFVWLVLVAAVITGPVYAAPKQVIQPNAKEQTSPPLIQQERKQQTKLAEPDENGQPGPSGAGIDECEAHCPNGVGW